MNEVNNNMIDRLEHFTLSTCCDVINEAEQSVNVHRFKIVYQ